MSRFSKQKKFIISESQLTKIINENLELWYNEKYSEIQLAVSESLQQLSPCGYDDEFEYVKHTIDNVIDILNIGDGYENIKDKVRSIIKEDFGEELFEIHISNCVDNEYEYE